MSDDKDPFDPFGRSDRTIIRPNPGGRRPAAPAPQPPPAPSPYAPQPAAPQGYPPQPGYPPPQGYPPQPAYPPPQGYPPQPGYPPPPPPPPSYPGYTPQQGYPPQPANQPPPAYAPPPQAWDPQAPSPDAWAAAPVPAPRPEPPPPPQPIAPPPNLRGALGEMPFATNENVIMSAAAPILMLLGRLRIALAQAPFAVLMDQVDAAIRRFDATLHEHGVSSEQARQARYALCATADDIVQNIPTQDRQLWTQYSMLSRFFSERTGGVRFFEELDRAKQDPLLNYDVLELFHACLALGFQGVHRTSAGGQATLQTIQRNLYETLRRVKPRTNEDLSPRWRGMNLVARVAALRIPFWASASFVGLILLGAFLTLRSLLSGGTGALLDDMARTFPTSEVAIERRIFQPVQAAVAPPPPIGTTQLERVRAALADEIAASQVEVEGTPNSILVRVGNFVSFAPGSANVMDAFLPLAEAIAEALEEEPGAIRIVGHSDSTPISSVRFASNYELSLARADAVAAVVAEHLSDPERIVTEGKGDTQPLATNETAEGRARNRRVEVLIPHAR